MTTLLIILILVGINAFYVAAEYSVVGVGRIRARRLSREGRFGARILEPMVVEPRRLDRAITACQVGISASSLALGAYSQTVLAPALEPLLAGWGWLGDAAAVSLSVVLVLLATSGFQIVLGEQVPKSIAVRDPGKWAPRTAVPLRISTWLFAPFIAFLSGSANLLLRLMGLPVLPEHHLHSGTELTWLVAQSARAGVLRPDVENRLRGALTFAARTARDVMVPRVRVRALPETATLDEIRAYIAETGHTRIPIYRGSLDTIVGVLHAKELLLQEGSRASPGLGELLRKVPMVPWSTHSLVLLEQMKAERAAMAVVLDEHGGTAGIVTLEDLVEEIVGEVEDEFDRAAPKAGPLPDGRLRLRGEDALDWVAGRYGLKLESDEARTVGGLVMERLNRVARPGDAVEVNGVTLEVERLQGRRIETVLAAVPPSTGEKG